MNIIGENIKNLRISKNLTQKELAKHLTVTSSTLSRWENGSRIPSSEDIDNISAFFSVPRSTICPEETIEIKKTHLRIAILSLLLIILFIGGSCVYKYYTESHFTLISKEAGTDYYGEYALFHHYLLPPNYTDKSWDSFCNKLLKDFQNVDNQEYDSYIFYFYKSKKDYPTTFELYYMCRKNAGED